jgi:hypothetical protein
VLHYNDGAKGVLAVLTYFGLCGRITATKSVKRNNERVGRLKRKSIDQDKRGRKKIRSEDKGFSDKQSAKETKESYATGGY